MNKKSQQINRSDSHVPCFFCGTIENCKHIVSVQPEIGYNHYDCKTCGNYQIQNDIRTDENYTLKDCNRKGAGIAAARKLRGRDKFFLCRDDSVEKIKNSPNAFEVIGISEFLKEFPENTEIYDKILQNLGKLISTHAGFYKFTNKKALDLFNYVYLYAATFDEVIIVINELKKLGYIAATNTIRDGFIDVCITVQGWQRLKDLEKQGDNSDKAFLAMWFDDDLNTFKSAVREAGELAGYKIETVNDKPYSDFVMNKVLNMIDESKFVIADFTCLPEGIAENEKIPKGVRGGVYLEAGYAMGQGKNVILTCKKNAASKSRLHFDIAQYNTIFWTESTDKNKLKALEEYDFVEYLKDTIIHIAGKGPHYKEKV